MDKLLTLKGAELLYDSAREEIKKASNELLEAMSAKADYIRITDDGKYFYLVSGGEGGEDIAGPFGPFAGEGGGGGGGGTGNNAILTLTNVSGWKTKTVPEGSVVFIDLDWSSLEDDEETGPGTYIVKVNGQTKRTQDIPQGQFTIRVNDYIDRGTSNKISITVSDVYDNRKTIAFTVSFVEYSLTSSFNYSKAYNTPISFSYKTIGDGDKHVHFLMDGKEFMEKIVSTSGREDVIEIPMSHKEYPEGFRWHGHHMFEVYFNVDTGVADITSDSLIYDLICYEDGEDDPIIASTFSTSEIMQYSNLIIPYFVYNTTSSESTVEYFIDGVSKGIIEHVPQTEQTWTYRVSDTGNHIFKIKSGVTEREFPVKVTSLDVDVHAETAGLYLNLSSENRSNLEPEEVRSVWEYNGIAAEFENFNWTTDGWMKDSAGFPVMRVKDDARITIPIYPFSKAEDDFRDNGRTFEFEFSTSSVFDYSTNIISCYSGGVGFKIDAQRALYSSSLSIIESQYKENEHVRISFVISKEDNDRLIYCYINGIISGIVRYTSSDAFNQNVPVQITIGSNDAVVDIYRIRIYKTDLSRFQMVNNWIADMQDSEKLLKYYKENNLYDNKGLLDFDKVRENLKELPYIVIETTTTTDKNGNLVGHLPTYKGEKLLCNGYYVNPVEPRLSFSWKNGEIDVQGTSSQAYPIKNFKLKIKKADEYGTPDQKSTSCSGFIMTSASEAEGSEVIFKKYSMRGYSDYTKYAEKDGKRKAANGYDGPLSVPTNTFVYKADYASSEGANNVELVGFYNDMCPYRTPRQSKDPNIRQGIDGFPMLWFGDDGEKISFIGKYNFNNHKGTDEVYGLEYGGETFEKVKNVSDYYRSVEGAPDESWEVTDNNNLIALWRRVAGDTTKTIIVKVDTVTGEETEVDYDDYTTGDNLQIVKNISLEPLFNGTYNTDYPGRIDDVVKYNEYVQIWQNRYEGDIDLWITEEAITDTHNSGDSLDENVKERRDFAMDLMKLDIRNQWGLQERQTSISPEEDMLGEWGKGEKAAHAFEVRFPSEWYDAHTEGQPEVVKVDRFVELQGWVNSTNRNTATGNILPTPVTYDKEYKYDTSEYRLAKFRAEFSRFFNLQDTVFYYLFTEAFLMIDSRVKNSFPTYFSVNHKAKAKDPYTGEWLYTETGKDEIVKENVDYFKKEGDFFIPFDAIPGNVAVDDVGNRLYVNVMTEEEDLEEITWADGHRTYYNEAEGKSYWPKGRWCWLPYDMDTAIGINNEGLLVFDYSLEDTEGLKGNEVVSYTDPTGVPVYNGATSVLWNNFRDAFPNEIHSEYESLRSGQFGYDEIERRFEAHQGMWPAAVFNEDAYYKYIKPLIETGEDRLGMCLGSKEQQRKWWLYNRFRFLDSKYTVGDAITNWISFRVNGLSDNPVVGITPYADIYVKMKVGEAWQSKGVKTYRNKKTNVRIGTSEAGDTEAYIYSADQIKEIEGLNRSLFISTLDISRAINLQHLDVSSETKNETLKALSVGANRLLRSITARNCAQLGSDSKYTTVDLKDCDQLEEAYFDGTVLLGINLPTGGRIRKVWLPNTITSLNIENQRKIEELKIVDEEGNWDTSNITSLIIGNVNKYVEQIAIDIIEGLSEGCSIRFTGFNIDVDTVEDLVTFLEKLDTLNGVSSEIADVSGTIHVLDRTHALDWERYDYYTKKYQDVVLDVKVEKTVNFYDYKGYPIINTETGEPLVLVAIDEPGVSGSVVYPQDDPYREDLETLHYDFNGWSLTVDGPSDFAQDDERVIRGINKDYDLYASYIKTPIYTVTFYSFDGTPVLDEQGHTYKEKTIGVGDVSFSRPLPSWGTTPMIGWGTVMYGSEDVECSSDLRTLINVSKSVSVYAIMDWPLETIWVENPPDKRDYYVEEYFDPTGMVVKGMKTVKGDQHREAVLTKYSYYSGKIRVGQFTVEIGVPEKGLSIDYDIRLATSMELISRPSRILYFTSTPEVISKPDVEGSELEVTFTSRTGSALEPKVIKLIPPVEGLSILVESLEGGELYEDFREPGTINIWYNYYNLSDSYQVQVIQSIDRNLDNNSWQTISAACDSDIARDYWYIGQEKKVHVGRVQVSDSTLDEADLYFRIVAFDHNADVESPGRHTITFGLSRIEVGSNMIEAGQSGSSILGSTEYRYDYSFGKGCKMRNVCDTYLFSLPDDLRPYVKTVKKYQAENNLTEEPESNGYYYADKLLSENVTIFIPSLCEITGLGKRDINTQISESEGSKCKQFEYYEVNVPGSGSADIQGVEGLIKYANYSPNPARAWWLRSFEYVSVKWLGSTKQVHHYFLMIDNKGKVVPYAGNNAALVVPFFNI